VNTTPPTITKSPHVPYTPIPSSYPAQLSTMATNSKLESMPTELKIAVLEQLPDIKTLSALIHASPIFHAVYLANREEILTSTTLHELSTKDRPISIDELLKAAALCHLVTKNGKLDPNLEPAIKACQAQARANSGKVCLKLSVDHCIALRTLLFYYGCEIAESPDREPDRRLVIFSNNKITYEEWSDPLRGCFVHVLVLGDYDPHEIIFSRSWSPRVGNALGAWFIALMYGHPRAVKRVGRVWISGDGTPVTAQESRSGILNRTLRCWIIFSSAFRWQGHDRALASATETR